MSTTDRKTTQQLHDTVAPQDITRLSLDTTSLDAQWTRIGGGMTVRPSRHPVDVEQLIIASATAAHGDARLFWVMASWIAVHHKLVNIRRLDRLLDATSDALTSATAGAVMDVALVLTGNVKSLKVLRKHCRPLRQSRPLFDVIREHPVLAQIAQQESRPEFAAWGLWQHDVIDKRDAIRPVRWILQHCPEFRFRSLFGADLEAAILEQISVTPMTISDLARQTGTTRAAVHEVIETLAARGLAWKPWAGYRKVVSMPRGVGEWLLHFPAQE